MVFAEQGGVRGHRKGKRVERGANVRAHRHLGQRDGKATIGQVMDRVHALRDEASDEVAVTTLRHKVDRWRRAVRPTADVAQVDRLAEPSRRRADQT